MKKVVKIISEAGERIDAFLAKEYPGHSRSYFGDLISSGKVFVNGKSVKASYKLKENDEITVELISEEEADELKAENIPLDIIFKNDDVIVLNKQPNIVVHPAAGNTTGTLVNALLYHFPKISEAVYDEDSEVSRIRPGMVHRLDKDTSGVLIVAKNVRAMHSLSRQIQNRNVKKEYLALCYGWPKEESGKLLSYLGRHPKNRKMIANIGEEKGREAISFYKVKEYLSDKKGNKYSLIEFDIKTGRTHQIRVQAADMHHPVMGDSAYGTKSSIKLSHDLGAERQLLHAEKLSVTLPGDTKQTTFEAPVPKDFDRTLAKLSQDN